METIKQGISKTMTSIKNNKKEEVFFKKTDLDLLFKKSSTMALEGDYEINSDNEKIIETLKMYFSGLNDFNKYGCVSNEPSINKGIYLWGDNGVGKSFFFKIMNLIGQSIKNKEKFITRLNFKSINSVLFAEEYMIEVKKRPENTNFNLNKYYNNNLYIGDLGKEPLVFGKKELIGDLVYIRNRYDRFTFITSNLSPYQAALRYGTAFVDRVSQDCNIIHWTGKSFR